MKSKNKVKYNKECVVCTQPYQGRIDSETCCNSCRFKLFQLGFKGSTCKELFAVLNKKEFDRFLENNIDTISRYTWFEDKHQMIHVYIWNETFIELRDKLKLK